MKKILFVLYFIIVFIVIVLLTRFDNEKISKRDIQLVYVIVADDFDSQGTLCELFHSVIWNEWPLMFVLGWDRTRNNSKRTDYASVLRKESSQYHTFMLGSKLTLVRKFLNNNITSASHIVVTDAYDTILQESYKTFLYKYHHVLKSPVAMFSTENDCWPPSFCHLYKSPSQNDIYYHLNSGGYVGHVSFLRRILDEAIRDDNPDYYRHHLYFQLHSNHVISEGERDMLYENVTNPDFIDKSLLAEYRVPGVYKRNDQIIFSMLYFTDKFNITLDKQVHFWQSMHLSRENHQKHIGMRLYSDNITIRLANIVSLQPIFPTFIHFNGPSKSLDENFTPHNMKRIRQTLWYKRGQFRHEKDIYQEMQHRIIILDRFMQKVIVDFSSHC